VTFRNRSNLRICPSGRLVEVAYAKGTEKLNKGESIALPMFAFLDAQFQFGESNRRDVYVLKRMLLQFLDDICGLLFDDINANVGVK
jgi:hypothetical protein